eukprot:1161342-Pelagomonas_calceolata.AAC.15
MRLPGDYANLCYITVSGGLSKPLNWTKSGAVFHNTKQFSCALSEVDTKNPRRPCRSERHMRAMTEEGEGHIASRAA